jgi:hypothetical protein
MTCITCGKDDTCSEVLVAEPEETRLGIGGNISKWISDKHGVMITKFN